jgi:hypothetical protein
VFAPSVSTTMVSGSYPPPDVPSGRSTPVAATSGLISAIASMEARMPSPMAVPREVRRVPIAASSLSLSVVGSTSSAATPENATSPTLVPFFCALMKSRAAFCAAVSRFGSTSVEHIEEDTSTASRIDEESEACSTDACGRAAPTARTTSPAANSHSGMRRRHSDRPGRAARITATLDIVSAVRRRRRRIHQRAPSSSGKAASATSAQGHDSDIRGSVRTSRPSAPRRS